VGRFPSGERAPRQVLLVGSRSGALAAALRLGLGLRVLHERPLTADLARRVPLHRRVGLASRREVLEGVRRLCAGTEIAAVVALGERAVAAAAWAREELGLAGDPPEVALRCTDKLEMKRAAAAAGLPCAPWRPVGPGSDARALAAELGLPLVLKRARSSGGRGQVVARDVAELQRALPARELAEGLLRGREVSVESLVRGGRVEFTNATEYLVPEHANVLPAALAPREREELFALNERVLRAMGVARGMTHVELFLTADGPLFGEIAARPPGGRIMALLERAWGFDPWRALLELELGAAPRFPAAPRRTAGVWILHPGEGEVAAIEGLEAARAVPGVRRVVCRLAPGERVPPRAGRGQDVGYIQAEGPDRPAVVRALECARAALAIRLRGGPAVGGA